MVGIVDTSHPHGLFGFRKRFQIGCLLGVLNILRFGCMSEDNPARYINMLFNTNAFCL